MAKDPFHDLKWNGPSLRSVQKILLAAVVIPEPPKLPHVWYVEEKNSPDYVEWREPTDNETNNDDM